MLWAIILSTVCVASVLGCPSAASNFRCRAMSRVVHFWSELGWKRVVVWSLENASSGLSRHEAFHLHALGSQRGLQISVSIRAMHNWENTFCDKAGSDASSNATLVAWNVLPSECIFTGLRPYTYMIVASPSVEDTVKKDLEDMATKAGFYLSDGKKLWMAMGQGVIPILNEVTASPASTVYDMHGGVIDTYGLPWLPFMFFPAVCDYKAATDPGEDCDNSMAGNGAVVDILKIMGQRFFNFTVKIQKEPSGSYGYGPGSWSDPNATFTGLVAKVVERKIDIALPLWYWLSDRADRLDFSVAVGQLTVLLIKHQADQTWDTNLFLRPFTPESWAGIIACLVVFVLAISLNPENGPSQRIFAFVAWAFFLLIQAFYSGTLTAEFTTARSEPFRTVYEGLQLYPQWNQILLAGDYWPYTLLDWNDPLVQRSHFRVTHPDYKYLAKDIIEVLDMLRRHPGTFYEVEVQNFISQLAMRGFGLEEASRDLTPFGEQKTKSLHFLLPKNSPMKPMLDKGIRKLIESGAMAVLFDRWNTPFGGRRTTTKNAITIGQSVLIYLLMVVAGVFIAIVFCLELAWRKAGRKTFPASSPI